MGTRWYQDMFNAFLLDKSLKGRRRPQILPSSG
ncbi:hypothetical protein AYX15_07126 [Cryptococcus neoformans]|nr:hypothetical protein AYX15_07126 [Cryptococcus neoformans var. grubii]